MRRMKLMVKFIVEHVINPNKEVKRPSGRFLFLGANAFVPLQVNIFQIYGQKE